MIRSYTFNYKNRYQSFPIDITLRLCLSIPGKNYNILNIILSINKYSNNKIIQ